MRTIRLPLDTPLSAEIVAPVTVESVSCMLGHVAAGDIATPFHPVSPSELAVEQLPLAEGGYAIKVAIRPARSLQIHTVRLRFSVDLEGGGEAQIHHAAFPRLYQRMTLPAAAIRADAPRTTMAPSYYFDQAVGQQPLEFYPPLVVFADAGGAVLIGPLTEQRSRCGYEWHVLPDGTVVVDVLLSLWGIDALALAAGEVFESETLFVQAFASSQAFGPDLFETYNSVLRQRVGLTRRAAAPIGNSEIFWGTWNDRNIRDVNERMILDNARWIAGHCPTVKWIELDDGWQPLPPETDLHKPVPQGMADLGLYYGKQERVDRRRFPRGMRVLTDEVKAMGLRPMIWMTPSVMADSRLYHDHPEWFLEEARLHYCPDLRLLDFSLPQVRDYARHAMDVVFGQWGFEGCKLDFWPYAFILPTVRLREQGQTSTQWMRWFERELRQRLPADGLLLYCMDMPMGSPFRSTAFDQFRVYGDIEAVGGQLPLMEEQALWTAHLVGLAQVQRHFWAPNGDGVGLFDTPAWPDNIWRLWCAFLLGSGTLAEICGRFDRNPNHRRCHLLTQAASLARLGKAVTLPGYDWLAGDGRAPTVWIRHDAPGEVLVGLTNWGNEPLRVQVTAEMLGLGMRSAGVADIWEGNTLALGQWIEVPARDGMVLVSRD